MKSLKIAVVALTTSLLLQGCNDDDSDYIPPPQPPETNTNIAGLWRSDDANDNLAAIAFLDDGSYVQVQADRSQAMNDPKNGMEWGKYSVDKKSGKLTTSVVFDKNSNAGLSNSASRYVQLLNGKLMLKVNENNNGVIEDNEVYQFSKVEQKGMLGYWRGEESDQTLESVAFFDDGTYFHVQVDENKSLTNPENGLEWGQYTVDATTKRLITSQFFDDNGSNGLSEQRTRYVRISEDHTLSIDVDENQNGTIDEDENFDFLRAIKVLPEDHNINKDLLGLWQMNNTNNNLVAIAFLDDGTYLELQTDASLPVNDPSNGMEWGKYSLAKNSVLTTSQIFDGNSNSGLSDNVLRTVKIMNNTLTLGVDENNNGKIDSNEFYSFSKAKSENIFGIWDNKDTNHELLRVIFFENGTYAQLEIDEKAPFVANKPFSGLEWGDYSINNIGALTTNPRYDNNGDSGFSKPIARYVKVSDNTMTLNFDDNSNGIIESGETLVFKRR